MFDIKNWMNWPTTGIKNISEFGNYVKANWWGLLVLVIAIIVIGFIVIKGLQMFAKIFKSNN